MAKSYNDFLDGGVVTKKKINTPKKNFNKQFIKNFKSSSDIYSIDEDDIDEMIGEE